MKNVQRHQEAVPKYLVRRREDVLSFALVSLYSGEWCVLKDTKWPWFIQTYKASICPGQEPAKRTADV
jgi:hypothetical protein